MNKAQLVEALTTRIGDRRTAAAAVDGIVEVIVETVGSGRSVTLTGFGVFEPRRRAARVARNPRTGETVPVPETIVPSFRPGAAFREQIGNSEDAAAGATSAPRRAPRTGSARSSAAATNGTRSRGRSTRAAGTPRAAKAATSKAAAENGTAAAASKSTAAKKTTGRTTRAAASTTKAAATKSAAAKTPAKRPSRSKAAGT